MNAPSPVVASASPAMTSSTQPVQNQCALVRARYANPAKIRKAITPVAITSFAPCLGCAAGRRGVTTAGGRSGLADLLDAGRDARVAVVDRVLGEVAVPFSGSLGGLVRCGGEVAGGTGLPAVADVAGEG